MAKLDSAKPELSGGFSLPHAAAVALLVESLLVTALAVGLSGAHKVPPPKPQVVMLTFPLLPKPPAPRPAPPPPKPVAKPPPPRPKPVHHVVHRPPPRPQPVKAPDPAPAPVPLAMAPPAPDTIPAPPQPAPVPPPPPTPVPPGVNPGVEAHFHDQVRAAVQAAMRYPYAARLAHIAGRAKVSFAYLDGRVSAVKIIVSSGYDMLDDAALQAVSAAAYPSPPERLAGTVIPFEVWVRFYQIGPPSQ